MQSCTLAAWLVVEGCGPSIDSSLLMTVVLELGSANLCPETWTPNHIVHINNYPFLVFQDPGQGDSKPTGAVVVQKEKPYH